MRRLNQRRDVSRLGLFKGSLIIGLVGGLLFFYVWWPIQAQRNLVILKSLEADISQKKADLNRLQERYLSLTSLSALDQWAKKHGPWKAPQAHDLLSIPAPINNQ